MKLSNTMHDAVIDAYQRTIKDADDQRVKCAANTLAALRKRGLVYPADTTIAFQLTPEGFKYGEMVSLYAGPGLLHRDSKRRTDSESRAERKARGTRKYRRMGTKARNNRHEPTNVHYKGKPADIFRARAA